MKARDYPLELATAAVSARDALRGEAVPHLEGLIARLPVAHPQRRELSHVLSVVSAAVDRLRFALKARERTTGRVG